MKIKFQLKKRNYILTGIFFACAVLSHFLVGISWFNTVVFTLLMFVGSILQVEFYKKLNWLWTVLIIGVSCTMSTYLIQYILLVSDLRSRISSEKFILNILCCLVVYLVVLAITNHVSRTGIISHLLLLLFGGINYFVYAFRGNEFTFGDLKSVTTGLSVASNYKFQLDAQAVNAILLTAIYIVWLLRVKIRFEKKWLMRLVCASLIILLCFIVGERTTYTVTETWEQKGSYRNGYVLNFVLSIRDSFVEKPDGYNVKEVDKITSAYKNSDGTAKDEKTGLKDGEKPTIICIMDESFADLRLLGNLQTTETVTPFIDSLQENTVKGFVLSSVFGAKTPNSEWEFLTGNSMAWLPSGSVSYQQYVNQRNGYSMVDIMKKQGYKTVAMHPYYSTGWSRNTVYPILGFDETYFLDSFDQTNLIRNYVSDETLFDKIISRYEEGKDSENLFLMGITMQNHGGYTETFSNFNSDIRSTNAGYYDVNQYLSLIHQTDKAVEKLINYFSKVDKPVEICFFGDHQPSLNTSFYQNLNGKGLSGLTTDELEELYSVPFFIWTNYESESKTIDRTSLNFLSSMVMERADLPLTPYQQYLSDLMEVVPAMNARAYYSKTEGKFIHYPAATGDEAEWLAKYQALQYNGLFDKKNQNALFFQR